MRYKIFPGSMGAAGLACDLFGAGKVDAGSWMTPVYVNDITEEEYNTAKELLADYKLQMEPVNAG